jgi:hypothetical protein
MTGGGDNENKMATHLPRASDEATDVVALLLADPALDPTGDDRSDQVALASALYAIRGLAAIEAPAPSAELAARFAAVPPLSLAKARMSRRSKLIAGTIIAGVSTVGLTGVAAANDQLPDGPQNVVSRVVDDLTPFTIDRAHPTAPTGRPSPTDTSPSSLVEPSNEPSDDTPSGPSGSDGSAPGGSGSASQDGADRSDPAGPGPYSSGARNESDSPEPRQGGATGTATNRPGGERESGSRPSASAGPSEHQVSSSPTSSGGSGD